MSYNVGDLVKFVSVYPEEEDAGMMGIVVSREIGITNMIQLEIKWNKYNQTWLLVASALELVNAAGTVHAI